VSKILIAASIALLLIVVIPKTVKYWPVGKAQDVAYIWLNQSKLIHLLELAKQTPYKHIIWCKEDPYIDGYFENGDSLYLEWRSDDNITDFVEYAIEFDVSCFGGRQWQGKWLLLGSSDVEMLDSQDKSLRRVKNISRHYFHSSKPVNEKCTSKPSQEFENKSCTIHLFAGWYMYGDWFITTGEIASNET
jgi:hypothetical protein